MIDRPENPFGSRFTRPGALPFLVPSSQVDDLDSQIDADMPAAAPTAWLENLLNQITSSERTAIIGPHGSGKTTLLGQIAEQLEKARPGRIGRVTLKIDEPHSTLWSELDRLSEAAAAAASATPSSNLPILMIDGFEQLGWIGRLQLAWRVRRSPVLLLVTAHQPPPGFRVILNLSGDREIARRLTFWLLRDFPSLHKLAETEFDAFWTQAQGNVRDLWAILYDWFESHLQLTRESSVGS